MIGHQDALAYGVHWRYEEGRSDIKDVTGDYPAVYGWDIGGIEKEGNSKNLDAVPFDKMKSFIEAAYNRGAVNTISWHVVSPLGAGKTAWDTTKGAVATILPAGSNHTLYKQWLNKVADFISSLKGKNGEPVPVLFRPFHEHTGSWFWWGKDFCTPEEYKALWRFTVQYLQQEKKLHNLLYVFNTSGDIVTEADFLERYPGDDVVDMLSIDTYQYDDPQQGNTFITKTNAALTLVNDIAIKKNKLLALAETGYEAIPYEAWWTKTLLPAVGANKISYVLLWRNHGYNEWMKKMHYYAPYKGQVSAADFIKFFNLPQTLFEKQAAAANLYQLNN